MARSVSTTLRQAMFARLTDEFLIFLLTITGDDLDETIRLSADPTERLSEDPLEYGTTSRGNEYRYMPLSVVLPQDTDEEAPQVRLRVDNVSRELVEALRSIRKPLEIQIEMVLKSDPDTVEIDLPAYLFRQVTVDELSIEAELRLENLADEPFPAHSFTPGYFPALFAGIT